MDKRERIFEALVEQLKAAREERLDMLAYLLSLAIEELNDQIRAMRRASA